MLDQLRGVLRDLGSVVVAFSGGADSAFLAWVANDTLGFDRSLSVTAVSASLADIEAEDCALLAREWNLNWATAVTDEMANAAYRINDRDRCFHCKSALMDAIGPVAAQRGATVVLGVNCDDLSDHRPGQVAAEQQGARFPLVETGFTKADVREWSERLGLRTWDKPAAACLASRLPYGTAVSVTLLRQVDRAEAAVKQLGFDALRVRHYDDTARIEVPVGHFAAVIERRIEIVEAVRGAGYRYVTLDLEGLRSGNLNH